MKERPIIFSTEMVKAILDDRKTQTRRVKLLERFNKNPIGWIAEYIPFGNEWAFKNLSSMAIFRIRCPYGQVGDRLWVKETFCQLCYKKDGVQDICYKEDLIRHNMMPSETVTTTCKLKWSSSLFMPRWASRITLEITGIRVERLQEITEDDCCREGIKPPRGSGIESPTWMIIDYLKGEYKVLWDSINAKRGYSWESNPWVWCLSFKRIKP